MHEQGEVVKQDPHARADLQRADSAGAGAERDGKSGPHAAAAPPVLVAASPGAPTAGSGPALAPFTGRLQPQLRAAGALLQRLSFLTTWGRPGARRPVRRRRTLLS